MNKDVLNELLGWGAARIALVGVLAILALFLLAETVSVAANLGRPANPATDTITVSGSGTVTLPPDIAHLSFTVQNSASTVAAAQTATTKQANAAIEYLSRQGIADKDVKTLSYQIYPQYSYPRPCTTDAFCPADQSPKITGYQVSESVQVTVRDLTKVGDLLQGLGKLEVQNVSGPDFALDDENQGPDAARAAAIENAKQEAGALAAELGVRLGKIVSFSESSGYYPYPIKAYGMGGAATDSSAPAPSIPTGQNTYNATVSVTYEIR